MVKQAHIVLILLLAAFVAGSTVHAARAATMYAHLAVSAVNSHHGDCQDCPNGNNDRPPCGDVCPASTLALPLPALDEPLEGGPAFLVAAACDRVVRTGPPDPYPPRAIVLS